jgi:anti-sigma regulatory factor (Ser/Thr protein kinase)
LKQTRTFDCRPEAVTAVRRFVRGALAEQPPRLVEAAELMASELATNCVRHAQTDFELAVEVDDAIRIEARDVDRSQPKVRSPAPSEPSGRGLRIVQALSDAWGVTPSDDGKTVWFAIYKPDGASAGTSSASRSRQGEGSSGVRRRAGRARSVDGGRAGGLLACA